MPAPLRTAAGAARFPFTTHSLWRLAAWGTSAGVALIVAVLASRGETASDRVSSAMASWSGRPGSVTSQAAKRGFDAESETRRLADTVRVLTSDRDYLITRVTALEQNLDDITGSVTKQLEAARAAMPKAPPWPSDEVPSVAEPATIAATLVTPTPAPAPAGLPMMAPGSATVPNATAATDTFAVDIGTGATVEALRVRWNAIRLAHAQLFEGMEPLVTITDTHKASRVELRLIIGPMPNADAAAQMCASLAAFRVACQPAMFEGQHLAQR
jgi:hypothetical protein